MSVLEEMPDGICGHKPTSEYATEKPSAEDYGWDEANKVVYCSREIWEEQDTDHCVWHANIYQKEMSDFPTPLAKMGERLDEAFLCKADLEEWNCPSGTALVGASIVGANLQHADLSGVDLRHADLANAELGCSPVTEYFPRPRFATEDDQGSYSPAKLGDLGYSSKDFEGANLADADLRHANLKDANLRRAILTGVNLRHANVTGAKFSSQDPHQELGGPPEIIDVGVTRTDLTEADLRDADFTNTHLKNVDLTGADLTDGTFISANLASAELTATTLGRANFTDAALSNADFDDATLRQVNLTDADLRGADFTGAILWDADLSDTALDGANFTDANLRHADLINADLVRAHIVDAALGGANLTCANLRDAEIINSYLREADLSGANLRRVDLINVTLIRANLAEVNLKNADLTGSNLQAVDLTDSLLTSARLSKSILEGADLTRADLQGATLTGAALAGIITTDAQIDGRTRVLDDGEYWWQHDLCVYDPRYDAGDDGMVFPLNKQTVASETGSDDVVKTASIDDLEFSDIHDCLDRAADTYRTFEELASNNARPQLQATCYVRRHDIKRMKYYHNTNRTSVLDDPSDHIESYANWIFQWISWGTMKYGESSWRVIYTSIVVVLACGLVYLLAGGITPNAANVRSPNTLDYLYFSVRTFSTLGYGDYRPAGEVGQALASLQSLVGAGLIALLIAVLGRRLMR